MNYVYGPNAAVKTTVSRLIADPSQSQFSRCGIHWERGTKLETLVYNRDFVSANFDQSPELPGIFTLGQENKETQRKIDETHKEVEAQVHKIEQDTFTLEGNDGTGGKRGELSAIESAFAEECWKLKIKHDAAFQGAMAGFRDSKQKLKAKLISECAKPAQQLPTLSELQTRAASVFGPAPTVEAMIRVSIDAKFLEWQRDPILSKRVIGKEDVDIAAMIRKLENSDWVKQGIPYFQRNDGICPFCQQNAPESLAANLAAYFDETFAKDTASISSLDGGYRIEGEAIGQTLNAAISSNSRFLDVERLKAAKTLFDSKFQLNQQRIAIKLKEPSQIVELEDLSEVLKEARNVISEANTKITAHNQMVNNLASEKAKLTNQVWGYLAQVEIDAESKRYNREKSGVERAIESLDKRIADSRRDKALKEREIRDLEKTVTSIKPTVDEINRILAAFGFMNLSVEPTDTNHYRILRADGKDAKLTLSEGEASFITFLYFYHLLKGSNTESGVTRDRVVVFDDPVSSLDSDVLFVVSSLIKHVVEDVRERRGLVKQVFVFTHNVYFHKEVTFNQRLPNGTRLADETFWTIRKLNGISKLQYYESNPITTSYDLLWSEIRNPNPGSQMIQNTMRRIIENYFRISGGKSPDEILKHFDGEQKLICHSLLSWINEGSHAIPDDVFVAEDAATVEKYLQVFKQVFVQMGHENHYNMMMKIPAASGPAAVAPPVLASTAA